MNNQLIEYKHKNQLTKSLNPLLGFGWNTGARLKKRDIKSKKNTFKSE